MAGSADVERGVGMRPTPAAGTPNGYPAVSMAPQGENPVVVSCPSMIVEGQESDLTGAVACGSVTLLLPHCRITGGKFGATGVKVCHVQAARCLVIPSQHSC